MIGCDIEHAFCLEVGGEMETLFNLYFTMIKFPAGEQNTILSNRPTTHFH